MPRYKITIEYDGSNFSGWQKQKDARSIQKEIEKAIFALSGEIVDVIGSGRTDAGVHALGQVAHFDVSKEYEPYNVVNAINHYIKPNPISIINAEKVTEEFHARFSARKRYYKYIIINRLSPLTIEKNHAWLVKDELSVEKMQVAARFIEGHHDFSSFRASLCQALSPIKTLDEIRIEKAEDKIIFYLSARSFLHHMVRNIVGTLKHIGTGKWQPEEVKRILEAKDRSKAGPTAPPDGLFFFKVDY